MTGRPDVIIIGSGIGGATLAAALATTGRRILVLERGERLEPSGDDRDEAAIFARGVYRPAETWLDGQGAPFSPGNYYNVGGNSKFYGAALLRYREADFDPIRHMGGTTPGWPLTYAELEPFYTEAEQLYQVRSGDGDPTEPPHSGGYAYPPVPHEPDIAQLADRLKNVGLHPATIPLGVDLDHWLARASTPWDAFPDTTGAKKDAETALNHALTYPNVTLRTGAHVHRLRIGADGRITTVELTNGEQITAPQVALAAGAVQSAAVLLRSATELYPGGLSNRSDQVGRNFMNHNCSAVMALHPFRRNRAVYQKTLMFNDFYHSGGPNGEPLGNVQMLGKISGTILGTASRVPPVLAKWIAARSFDFYAMSEDLPHPDSRVTLSQNGEITLNWQRSNWQAHEALIKRLRHTLRRIGFPLVLSRPFDWRTPSHQCGTARMGDDPATSVVNPWGQSHDHPNLWITDASILPTSAAVNPGLTIAALALRTAGHMAKA